MQRLGFGPMSIQLDMAAEKQVRIHLVRGRGDYRNYKTESGQQIRTECLPALRAAGIDPDNETLVIFCNMSVWDEKNRQIRQNSPYYAGGSHRSGTAWQVDSPILNLDDLDEKGQHVQDGQYGKISLGQYNSIFIGGIAHELGHALGLPHNRERGDERASFGTALMGSGNRTYGENLRGESKGSFLTLAHGLRLASHPMFRGSIKGIDIKPSDSLSNLRLQPKGKGFTLTGQVRGEPPVYAIVGYMDPEGGGDYDATTATAIPAADGSFTLDCQALAAGKTGELRVNVLHVNGSKQGWMGDTPHIYSYRVAPDGTVDISAASTALALKPLIDALEKNDTIAIKTALSSPEIKNHQKTSDIAQRIASPNKKTQSIAAIPASIKEIPLSDIACATEQIGYGPPLRDRPPSPQVLLQSNGMIYRHGLFSHAPATQTWLLNGAWKTIHGKAGKITGSSGRAQFQIIGDGKVLWDSGIINEAQSPNFRVDLNGVKELKLVTADGGDGMNHDWTAWLEPTLER